MDKGRYREELRALEESCKPIDEAIARQSVTSEEVQRAIEWAQEEADYYLRKLMFANVDHASLAIKALRQMRSEQVTNVIQDSLQYESEG